MNRDGHVHVSDLINAGIAASDGAGGLMSGSMPNIVIVGSDTSAVATAYTPGLSLATSSGDPSTVLQAAINALMPIGGLIHLRGKLTLTSGVTTYPGIGIIGQGPLSQGTQSPSLIVGTSAVTGPIFTIAFDSGGTGWQSFPYFADFALKGSGVGNTGQDGIYCSDANILDVILRRVLMFDIGGNGWHQGSSATGIKTWIDGCYFERCQQNGVRNERGSCQIRGCYIQNNALYGIDGTSSSFLQAFGNYVWANASGAVLLWSMTSGIDFSHNNLNNNGDNTHPAILVKSISSMSKRALIANNTILDTRASGSAMQYGIENQFGVYATIIGNTISGQKSGNPAVHLTANAGDNLMIRSNPGFNDTVGAITNPLDTSNNRCGIAGTTATPVASTDYVVSDVDQIVSLSGGSGLSITIKDPAGNTVSSGLSTLVREHLPIGYTFNGGAFTGSPTVTSWLS